MYLREYSTLKALRRGEIVDLGGIFVEMDEGEIQPGDLYIAERNTGPKLLIAREINLETGCVFPTEFGQYAFDIYECVKVREAE